MTVGLGLATTALVVAIWGNDARPCRAPAWLGNTTTVARRARSRTTASSRSSPRSSCSLALERLPAAHALRADHPRRRREPRDGDGARHRRAPRVHARLRDRRASPPRSPACSRTSTSATVDPQRGTSLLIFAFIVVVIGGLGSLRGTAIAAVVVGLVQQYANYYASSGLGDLSVVLLLGIVLLARPRGLSGELRVRRIVDPGRVVLVALALVPKLAVDIPYVFKSSLEHAGHAAAARAVPRLRRSRDDLRPAVRVHRACSRSGTRSTSRSASTSPRSRSRSGTGASARRSRSPRSSGSCCRSCSAPSRCASAGSRSRW